MKVLPSADSGGMNMSLGGGGHDSGPDDDGMDVNLIAMAWT
jgi:hypothetical protein